MGRRIVIAILTAALLAPAAGAAAFDAPSTGDADNFIFAAGGTPLSNGVFFPGTAVFNADTGGYDGVPYQIQQGTDVTFVNVDSVAVANAHKIRSEDRLIKTVKKRKKNGKIVKKKVDMGPLFQSKYSEGPEQSIVETSHLDPGIYAYVCSVHFGMAGLLQVVE